MVTNNRNNYSPTVNAAQVGGSNGALTSLAVGSTGNLLVGISSADPAFGATANINFTFGGANSGATRTLTVANTSDTLSSAANCKVSVAGATASDATFQSVISGGQNWTMGLDNSNSDIFAIASSSALGTTDVMDVQTTGEINYPLQTAFLAQDTTADNNVTGDGTVFTVTYSAEIFDQNNDFSSPTYTAPVTGRYFFASLVCTDGLTSAMTTGQLNIVTSNRTYKCHIWNFGAMRGSANLSRDNIAHMADMDSADTASITVAMSNGTKVADVSAVNNSAFAGVLLA